jgi:hypothetical protein
VAGIQYLPRDYNPWTQALPGFLQRIALQNLSQKFSAKQADKRQDFRRKTIEGEQDFFLKTRFDETPQEHVPAGASHVFHKGKFYLPKTNTPKDTALIQQYKFAQSQGYGGTFVDFKKTMAKASATNINIGEKVALHEAKKKVDLLQRVKRPDFALSVTKDLKAAHGDDWDIMAPYQKAEKQFWEMDSRVKAAYKDENVVFDDDRNPPGWYVGNKLVVRYKDPLNPRADKRH